MGSVIISAGQPDELAAKAEPVRRTVEAVDTDGRPVLRKDPPARPLVLMRSRYT